MNEHSEFALRRFLPERFDGLEQALKEGIGEQSSWAWNLLGGEAAEKLLSALDLDVFEIFARGWGKMRELAKYADRANYPPEESWVVHLGDHQTPVWHLHPVLQVIYADLPGPQLRFTLELSAHVRSVALTLCDGYITKAGAGDFSVRAQLKYGETALHKTAESKALKLGRPIEFKKPGIRIAPKERAAPS